MIIDPSVPATQTATSTGGEQDLELDVEGDIGAINYCDEDGNNCFQASNIATGLGSDIFEVNGAAGFEVVSSIDANVPYATADFVFGSPQLADDADATHDSRLFFDKSKGAFRVGTATTTEWNDANVGGNSIGMGYNAQALGASAIAIGQSTNAPGGLSVALGSQATALRDTFKCNWSFCNSFGRLCYRSGI